MNDPTNPDAKDRIFEHVSRTIEEFRRLRLRMRGVDEDKRWKIKLGPISTAGLVVPPPSAPEGSLIDGEFTLDTFECFAEEFAALDEAQRALVKTWDTLREIAIQLAKLESFDGCSQEDAARHDDNGLSRSLELNKARVHEQLLRAAEVSEGTRMVLAACDEILGSLDSDEHDETLQPLLSAARTYLRRAVGELRQPSAEGHLDEDAAYVKARDLIKEKAVGIAEQRLRLTLCILYWFH